MFYVEEVKNWGECIKHQDRRTNEGQCFIIFIHNTSGLITIIRFIQHVTSHQTQEVESQLKHFISKWTSTWLQQFRCVWRQRSSRGVNRRLHVCVCPTPVFVFCSRAPSGLQIRWWLRPEETPGSTWSHLMPDRTEPWAWPRQSRWLAPPATRQQESVCKSTLGLALAAS